MLPDANPHPALPHGVLEDVIHRHRSVQPLWIDGHPVTPADRLDFPVENPADGTLLTRCYEAGPEEVNQAVAAALRCGASRTWSTMDPSARQCLLLRIAAGIEARSTELGLVESLHNGKTLQEGLADVAPSADVFRYYASWTRILGGRTAPVDGGSLVYTLRQPVGVCGAIVAWNYPLLLASWKIAPALAAGCTVVLKPSELTPLTALILAEICQEAGVPAGALNVVPGAGNRTGQALARHMQVAKLAFTGSVRTARTLLEASAASNLKRLSLELGGKSPLLVFADADLDAAVDAAAAGIFANKGEVCSASARILVQRQLRPELIARLRMRAERLKVGHPLAADTDMGAVVSQAQLGRINDFIQSGQAQGARLVTGGHALRGGDLPSGYYMAPTIFEGVDPAMTIAREEIFGPVLSVIDFDTETEALHIANDSSYGLAAAVFTRDMARAHRCAQALNCGVVWVNRWNGFDSGAPFGGTKQSGWGMEMGAEALESYTQTKCVWAHSPSGSRGE